MISYALCVSFLKKHLYIFPTSSANIQIYRTQLCIWCNKYSFKFVYSFIVSKLIMLKSHKQEYTIKSISINIQKVWNKIILCIKIVWIFLLLALNTKFIWMYFPQQNLPYSYCLVPKYQILVLEENRNLISEL